MKHESQETKDIQHKVRYELANEFLKRFLPPLQLGIIAIVLYHVIIGAELLSFISAVLPIPIFYVAQHLRKKGKPLQGTYVLLATMLAALLMQMIMFSSYRTVGGLVFTAVALIWSGFFTSTTVTLIFWGIITVSSIAMVILNKLSILSESLLPDPVVGIAAAVIGNLVIIITVISVVSYLMKTIQKQMRVSNELKESKQFTIDAVDNSQELFGWLSPDGTLQFANKTALKMINATPMDVLGKKFWETPWFAHSEKEQKRLKENITWATKGETVHYESIHLTPAGEKRYVDLRLNPIKSRDDRVYMIVAESIDSTEKRRTEIALQKLSTSFAHLEGKPFFEAVCAHIAEDFGLGMVYVGQLNESEDTLTVLGGFNNGSTMDELQYSLENTPCSTVLDEGYAIFPKHVTSYYPKDPLLEDLNIQGFAGSTIYGRNGAPIGVLVALHHKEIAISDQLKDIFSLFINRIGAEMQRTTAERILNEEIAHREQLTEQLHQSQKMDAIGQLAGGVAHDFNNMLGGILGAAEIIKDGCPEDEQEEFINMIITAAKRSSYLTKQLLAFSRKSSKMSSDIDVMDVIISTTQLLERTIDKAVSVSYTNSAEFTRIVGDNSLLQNALMNMGINASHAMPNGGSLTFEVSNVYLDSEYCEASPFNIKSGDFVEIAVKDTGEGIPFDLQKRIFEPFFTTKEEGKGTGLGLAAVYGMVQEHDGAITVYSEVGQGTVFHIYLPVSMSVALSKSDVNDEIHSGDGVILLIDDEELIRIAARSMLTSMGYKIFLAENGKEGVEIFKEIRQDVHIDLIILDMIMPVMGGREAFEQIREIDPNIPVLIASGFTKEDDMSSLKEGNINGFLQKPFRKAELAEAVVRAISMR